ncbi:hypothetical protein HYS54_02660 [Candidatus Micrarchaeota archaeon]|nr:hypothetical protein [Candidatus Micrarchaeota archaeon]
MEMKEAQEHTRNVGKGLKQWDAFQRVTDLLEEAGEVAAEVKAINGMKQRKGSREALALELADTLYSIMAIANYYDIDLESVFKAKVDKYTQRFSKEATK